MSMRWTCEDGTTFKSLPEARLYSDIMGFTELIRLTPSLQPDNCTDPAEFKQYILQLQEIKVQNPDQDVYFNTDGAFLLDKIRIMTEVANDPFFWQVSYWPARDDPDKTQPLTCEYTWYE